MALRYVLRHSETPKQYPKLAVKDVQKWGDYPTSPSPAVLHKHSSDLEHRLEGGKVLQHTKFNHHQYRSLTWSMPTQQCQSFVIQALQFVLSICWGGGGGLKKDLSGLLVQVSVRSKEENLNITHYTTFFAHVRIRNGIESGVWTPLVPYMGTRLRT